MTERWEYMQVEWVATTSRKMIDGSPRQTHRSEIEIAAPGEEKEIRLSYDSENPEAQTENLLQVLNELGAEGWELIGEVVSESIIAPKSGWPQVGMPIRTQYLLKRPASAS